MRSNRFKLGLFLALTLTALLNSQSTIRAQEGTIDAGFVSHELSSDKLAEHPIIIGHRGASGFRPEHTLAAYELAIAMGPTTSSPTW
jgi:glycerophosphoryl diester phosphodiesterase